jgi:DNA polymerase III subunit delta'
MSFSRKAAVEHLRRAHEQNRLAHAYLISGPAGSGKREIAAQLASVVNGIDPDQVFGGNARDVFLAEPESKSRRIVIGQIRELEHGLQMRTANGRRKVVIISEADRLQPQAANAFLKTLEEPPKDSLLLLLSAMPEILPDTIVSRCIPIPLAAGEDEPLPEESDLVELLRTSANEKDWRVHHVYWISQGMQGLLTSIREEIKAENADALKREEARYRNSTDGVWLDEREDYYKALTESLYIQRRAALIEVLFKWWSDVLRTKTNVKHRDLPVAQTETAAIAQRLTASEILRRIRRLEELRDHLERNVQEALAIEMAFLEIFRAEGGT